MCGDKCDAAVCKFTSFMRCYKDRKPPTALSKGKKSARLCLEDGMMASMGVKAGDQTMDCGDFLKACLKSVCQSAATHLNDTRMSELCLVSLAWRFECSGCRRFIVTSYKDHVLRLDGVKEQSFGSMLNKFWATKQCPVSLFH